MPRRQKWLRNMLFAAARMDEALPKRSLEETQEDGGLPVTERTMA